MHAHARRIGPAGPGLNPTQKDNRQMVLAGMQIDRRPLTGIY
jgi:hypothetical protein